MEGDGSDFVEHPSTSIELPALIQGVASNTDDIDSFSFVLAEHSSVTFFILYTESQTDSRSGMTFDLHAIRF